MSFEAWISLLISCLDDLSIGIKGGVKVPHCYRVTISPFIAVSISHIYWGAAMLVAKVFTIVVFFLDLFLEYYVAYFLISCNSLYFKFDSILWLDTPAFFSFLFAWKIFFHPLTFSLCVFLGLKWISGIYMGLFFFFFFSLFIQSMSFGRCI